MEEATSNSTVLRPEDIGRVQVHAGTYVIAGFGVVFQTVYLARLVAKMGWLPSSKLKRVLAGLFFTLGLFGLSLHITSTGQDVITGGQANQDSMIQSGIAVLQKYTFVWAWGWLMLVFFGFLIPADKGIVFTFRLAGEKDASVSMNSSAVVQLSLTVACAVTFLSAILHKDGVDVSQDVGDSTLFPIAAGLKDRPLAFFATPLLVIATWMCGVGVTLTMVQARLQMGGFSPLLAVPGLGLIGSLFAGLVITVERERFAWIFAVGIIVFLSAWALATSFLNSTWRKAPLFSWRVFGHLAVFWALGSASAFHWAPGFLLLVWAPLYRLAGSDGPLLSVGLSSLND